METKRAERDLTVLTRSGKRAAPAGGTAGRRLRRRGPSSYPTLGRAAGRRTCRRAPATRSGAGAHEQPGMSVRPIVVERTALGAPGHGERRVELACERSPVVDVEQRVAIRPQHVRPDAGPGDGVDIGGPPARESPPRGLDELAGMRHPRRREVEGHARRGHPQPGHRVAQRLSCEEPFPRRRQGVGEDELDHPLREPGGEAELDPAAEGVPDERGAFEPQPVETGHEPVEHLAVGPAAADVVEVGRHHAASLGEQAGRPLVDRRSHGVAGQEHHRRAFADAEGDREAVVHPAA